MILAHGGTVGFLAELAVLIVPVIVLVVLAKRKTVTEDQEKKRDEG
jgi:hypothetical protein